MWNAIKGALLTAVLVAVPAIPSMAGEPSYRFIEGGAIATDPDVLESRDGWYLGGMFGASNFHVFGEYENNGNINEWFVGAGWHGLLGQKADIVAEAAYVDAEVDTGLGKVSDNGFRITGGVRWQIVKWIEINGFANYLELNDSGGEASVEVNGILTFAWFGLGAGYEVGETANDARIFLRFMF